MNLGEACTSIPLKKQAAWRVTVVNLAQWFRLYVTGKEDEVI